MQYYKLDFSCSTRETGSVYPQIQKMKEGYNYNSYNSVYSLGKCYNTLPDFEPDLNAFKLNSKAKLSDFLSNGIISSTGMLLSNKAKEILADCRLIDHKYFKAVVIQKNIEVDYWWIHFLSNVKSCVDYEKSKFIITKNYSNKIDYIDILSEEDLVKKRKILKENNPNQNLSIWAELIKFKKNFNKEVDLFYIGSFDNSYYVSENLRHLFIENMITGIEFKEVENIVID